MAFTGTDGVDLDAGLLQSPSELIAKHDVGGLGVDIRLQGAVRSLGELEQVLHVKLTRICDVITNKFRH